MTGMTMPTKRSLWLPYRKEVPQARLRLFCFPFAGSGASAFLNWPQFLPPEVEVCAVLPPGREKRLREPAFGCMDDLIDAALAGLAPYLDKPFALFGHSMGANVVFEFARRLEERGVVPLHAFISGRPGPHRTDVHTALHKMPDADLVEALLNLGGTPPDFLKNAELMAVMLPCVRADLMLTETYRAQPGARLSCPITALGGAHDPLFPADYLDSWGEATRGAFDVAAFPGGHFYYTEDPGPLLVAITERLRHLL